MATVTESFLVTIDDATATTHSFTGVTVAAGDLMIIRGNIGSDTITVSGVSDGTSNTWNQAVLQASGADNFEQILWYGVAVTALSSATVTVTLSATAIFEGSIASFNSDTGWPSQATVLDKTHGNYAQNTTAWTSGATATTTQADELLVGGCCRFNVNGSTSTPSGSWIEESDRAVTHPAQGRAVDQWQHVTSTGAYACDGTWTLAEFAVCVIATFKTAVAASGAAGSAQPLNPRMQMYMRPFAPTAAHPSYPDSSVGPAATVVLPPERITLQAVNRSSTT